MSLKIILADDSLTAQNMGRKILAEAGYEVIAVSNGAQAMKKIVSDKPDLVVLDVYMPGYSGLELCERLRNTRETARTPVVLTVGKMEAFKAEEVNRVGADGLIVKPFEATELVAVVKKLAETLTPTPRPKRQAESAAKKTVEPEPELPAEPELVQHHSVEVPDEIASEPVSGMYFLPQEEQAPAAAPAPQAAHAAAPPIEFEVERDAPAAEVESGPRMSSAAGLSGVFEVEPTAHAAVETPGQAAPIEEFERFSTAAPAEPQPEHPAADAGATTIAHEFDTFEPEHEPRSNGNIAPSEEAFSSAQVEIGLPSFAERFDQARPEPVIESVSAQTADVLPELAAWDEPLPAASSQGAWETAPPLQELAVTEPSAAELSATGSVWVAEETEIEPHESAISLHEQMQRGSVVDELLGAEPAAPAVSAESAFESWEAPEPLASNAVHPESDSSEPRETEILPEFEPNPYAGASEPVELASQDPHIADFPVEPMAAATVAPPAAKPVPAPDPEPYAASEPEPAPPVSVPVVSEAAADPMRIARIVEEALERLKPELIAAVTRQLEKKDQ